MTVFDEFGAEPFRKGHIDNMGFPLSAAQRDWHTRAARLGESALAPGAKTVDGGMFPAEALRSLWNGGILNMAVPTALGGQGADVLSQMIATETLAQHCASTALCFHMHGSVMQLLVRMNSGDSLSETVRDIVTNFRLCTYATSEAGSGARWWHMDQAAERDGDGYRIKATKSWATSAGEADYYVVPLRANPHAASNELTLFLVPGRVSGVTPLGTWDGSGMRGNSSTPVRFDLTVPVTARLGSSGHGFEFLLAYALPFFQLGLAAVYLGIAQAAYDAAALHAVQRVYSDTGNTKARSEVTQRDIAEMKTRLDAVRSLVYVVGRSITDREQNGEDLADFAIETDLMLGIAETKIVATEAALAITDASLRVCGGSAYKRGHIVERLYRDARAGSVMGLDNDALKVLIGQRLMGIPFPWSQA